jgi:hypothetical protein
MEAICYSETTAGLIGYIVLYLGTYKCYGHRRDNLKSNMSAIFSPQFTNHCTHTTYDVSCTK